MYEVLVCARTGVPSSTLQADICILSMQSHSAAPATPAVTVLLGEQFLEGSLTVSLWMSNHSVFEVRDALC